MYIEFINSNKYVRTLCIALLLVVSLVFVAVQTLAEQEERNGIERSRIIVGGFSQGGAVALYSSFALAQGSFGGVLALSSWLPLHTQFPAVCI